MACTRFSTFFPGALAAAALLLAGCTTSGGPEASPATPSTPMGPAQPAQPARAAKRTAPEPAIPVIVLEPATITGSEETSTMFDNFTAYIRAVDGTPVGDRNDWNRPVEIKAGTHRLTIAFIRGVFTAQTEITFTARPEGRYQLKFDSDAHVFGKNTYCEFWIVDTATGEKALAPTRAPLTRIEAGK